MVGITAAESGPDKDAFLKAAFIYKFTKFIQWPGNIKYSSLVLCTLGSDELVNVFDILNDKTDPNQKIIVQSITDSLAIDNCQILYIASSEKGSYRSLNVISSDKKLLTISELPGFVQAGGVIELTQEANRIRFDINLDAAHLNGLKISSKLLKLARKVKWDNKP